ncbi:MAG: ribosome recycling factor [Bacteroidetes bacterium]|nr:ribosome recycling factor [Bacteroidota bacterium]
MSNVNEMLTQLKDQLVKNLSHTHQEFSRIRAGKASPNMLDGVMVDYYGTPTPLNQVANIGTPDARTLTIQPWDKSLIRPIEATIINSNMGFAPQNDGEMIRINVPALTEDRRKDLVKMVKAEAENSKVGIRNIRKDFMEKAKSMHKDGLSEDEARGAEEEIQKTIDNYIKKTEDLLSAKEKEIMTV